MKKSHKFSHYFLIKTDKNEFDILSISKKYKVLEIFNRLALGPLVNYYYFFFIYLFGLENVWNVEKKYILRHAYQFVWVPVYFCRHSNIESVWKVHSGAPIPCIFKSYFFSRFVNAKIFLMIFIIYSRIYI